MQGYGNPQITFAVESLMDELAHKLDLDPIELRLKNYVGLGGTFWGQGPTVRSIVRSDGVPQLLRDAARRSDRLRRRDGEGQPGRLGGRHYGPHGPRRRDARGVCQAGLR